MDLTHKLLKNLPDLLSFKQSSIFRNSYNKKSYGCKLSKKIIMTPLKFWITLTTQKGYECCACKLWKYVCKLLKKYLKDDPKRIKSY